jgi:hypothetical protein
LVESGVFAQPTRSRPELVSHGATLQRSELLVVGLGEPDDEQLVDCRTIGGYGGEP